MRPYVLVVRQKPILEKRKEEKLEKVRGGSPSATYLEPNGALGFVPGSFSSRARVDVVATRSSPSFVVDSLIAMEGGNRDDRSGIFRGSVLPPPSPKKFGEPLLDKSTVARVSGTPASPVARHTGLWSHGV